MFRRFGVYANAPRINYILLRAGIRLIFYMIVKKVKKTSGTGFQPVH
jgi:hypothetical protein